MKYAWTGIGAAVLGLALVVGCTSMTPEQMAAKRMESGQKLEAQGYNRIPGPNLMQTLGDTTAYGTSVRGFEFILYSGADGTVRIKGTDGKFRDQGRVEVQGQMACYTWTRIRNGKTGCFETFRKGSEYLQIGETGDHEASFTLKPGNPEEL